MSWHPFYQSLDLPLKDTRGQPLQRGTATCRNCGEQIVKDRWVDGGWAHRKTADALCYPDPFPKKAQP